MKRFLFIISLFCIPFIIILVPYFVTDPFKVLYHYDSYYENGSPRGVILNRDYISTSTFCNLHKQYNYDSFIVGNSRSLFYEVEDWQTYIGKDCKAFHFDASGETLYGIFKKILYLDNTSTIKNMLIILDYSTLSEITSKTTHINYISPELEENENLIRFHMAFFYAFYNKDFFVPYFKSKLTGVMTYPLDERPFYYEKSSNEIKFTSFEEQISKGTFYTQKVIDAFECRNYNDSVSPQVIKQTQYEMLTTIKQVLDKHNTDYKIVINPLYNQIKLNPKDIQILSIIFENNIYDFSGKNRITDDYHNYYENSHYRPNVAAGIMRIVYEDDKVYQSFLLDSVFTRVNHN